MIVNSYQESLFRKEFSQLILKFLLFISIVASLVQTSVYLNQSFTRQIVLPLNLLSIALFYVAFKNPLETLILVESARVFSL
jgi:hypothetical protein